MANIVAGEHDWQKANPFGFPEINEPTDPYARPTSMSSINPQSNPYGQGGGLRGRLRDALLAGGSAGHNRNRMAPVMQARMWDRGMAPEQISYQQEQRNQQVYQQEQQDYTDAKKNNAAAYVDYVRKEMAAGRGVPMSMRSWLSLDEAGRSKLMGVDTSGSSNVAKTWTGEDGNLWYLQRDGVPKNTGIKGSPKAFEIVTEGGVSYAKQTLPGGEVKMTPLDRLAQEYRTTSKGNEKYATDKASDWAEKDTVFEDFVMTGAPMLQSRVADLREIKAKLDDGTLQTGIGSMGPLATLFDPEAGEASVVSMLETLKAVSEYGLTPVSDNDVDNIKAMFVDFWATGEVNSVKLGQAIEKMDYILRDTELKSRYFFDDGNNTLKGYTNKNRPRFDIGDGYTGPSKSSGPGGPVVVSTEEL